MNDQPKPNPYDAAIADARAKRDFWEQALKLLETLRDGASTDAGPLPASLAVPSGPSSAGEAPPRVIEIAPGTFHGKSIEDATRALLQFRKRALGTREITNSLRAGGIHLQSETPENTVASVLGRAFNAGSDIVRVSRGVWGLQEWYPNQRFIRRAED